MTRTKIFKYLLTILLFSGGAAHAQATGADANTAAAGDDDPRSPCEREARFGEFDFWIGTWDVHDPSGRLVGRNVIERTERGCLLVESWTGVAGSTGMSVNFFDHAAQEWVQIWNDGNGSQIEIRGGITDSGMLLEGVIHYVARDTTRPFRGTWTPLPDGRVRQYFEQSEDDGATWNPWFEGFYTRASEN